MEDRDLRVSDAEREYVGALLQRAVGQGLLSLGEFTERIDVALGAKTRGELNAVLLDLPGIAISPEHRPSPVQIPDPASTLPPATLPPATSPPATPSPGHYGEPVTVIKGRMSTVERRGQWTVPPSLRVDSKASSVNLDFTRALASTQVVHVTIDDYCSSISITLPPDATADVDGIETVGATVTSNVNGGPPYGPLHLVLHGKVRLGSCTVRYPFGTKLRQMLGRG